MEVRPDTLGLVESYRELRFAKRDLAGVSRGAAGANAREGVGLSAVHGHVIFPSRNTGLFLSRPWGPNLHYIIANTVHLMAEETQMRSAAFPTLTLLLILGATACHDSAIDYLTEPTGLSPTAEPMPDGPGTSAQAITDQEPGSCHFGKPVEVDEYNGLIYGYGGRFVPNVQGQIVDLWVVSPDLAEMPDDISWTCNPFELEDQVVLELAAHNDHPDDVTNFGLVQILDDIDSVIPSWYLAYQPPPAGETLNNFRRKMVLKLWNHGQLDSLVDSVQVTVTACFHPHPAFKQWCIQNAIGDDG